MTEIVLHVYKLGLPYFKVKWSSGEITLEWLRDMQENCTKLSVDYIVANNVSRSRHGCDPTIQWAKKVQCDFTRVICHLTWLYEFFLDDDDNI